MGNTSGESVPVQSVKRALDALDYLTVRATHGEAATLGEVAEQLGVPATTAHNLLKSMVICGYVGRDDSGGYCLGPKCRDISRGSHWSAARIEAARAILSALAEETGESVVLATLLDGRRHGLLAVEGGQVVRVRSDCEEPERFWVLVTSRVLAAYADADELAQVLRRQGLPGHRWDGVETEQDLSAALSGIRQAGRAETLTSGEQVFALAVPVNEPSGRVLAALGIFLPAFRADDTSQETVRRATATTASRLAALWQQGER